MRIGWRQILDNWGMVVQDLLDQGVDLMDPRIEDRPWVWLRSAIWSILDRSDSRVYQTLIQKA